ncbi:MAG TPA: hypothetical protein VHX17_08215 [Candidatus Cybelea sp.]|nr:hypothetical protein [Candidatus Cybelea sp.]
MNRLRHRFLLLTVGVLAGVVPPLAAPAALDMALGPRKVVQSQPVSACNQAARSALDSVIGGAQEIGSGDTGEWQAYNAGDTANGSTAAAAVHCYPVGSGYVATFTCAAQVPPSTDTASALCAKVAAAFDSKATAMNGRAGNAGRH